MTRRPRESDHYASVTAGLPMFAPSEPIKPAWAESWSSLTDDQRKARRERWKELLLPIVLELSARRAPDGVTWSEVTAVGVERCILWGERAFLSKYPRIYSWGGAWLSQLAKDGVLSAKTAHVDGYGALHLRRESTRELSHDNSGFIYTRAA